MRRYLSPGWLAGHVVALVLVVVCLALGWWQVQRAGEGNLSSYAYAVEWPIFAGFVAFVWFREIRSAQTQPAGEDEEQSRMAVHPPLSDRGAVPTTPALTDDPDEEVAAYNRMLAWLNADPHRRMSDYPG